MNKVKNCVICGRNLDEAFDLKPDKRKRVTCNKLHSRYMKNVNNYIVKKVREKLKKHGN